MWQSCKGNNVHRLVCYNTQEDSNNLQSRCYNTQSGSKNRHIKYATTKEKLTVASNNTLTGSNNCHKG